MSAYHSYLCRSGGQVVSMHPFYPTIRVWIPLTPTVLSVKFVFKKRNKQKDAGIGQFFKKTIPT